MIKHCFDDPSINSFDFGSGGYPWKFEWADSFNVMYQLEMWKKTPKNKLLETIKKIKAIQ